MSTTAKAYINNLKLKQSKYLIKEYKYSIGEISEMMGFNSIHYFSNSFKKKKYLIKEYKYSIGEISEMMGFNSIHYFSNSFKKKYGVSPSEYLKSINKLV